MINLKSNYLKILAAMATLNLMLVGCDKATTRKATLPSYAIQCSTNLCKHNGTSFSFIYVTTSGCTNIGFDLKATGTATLTCTTTSGCAGTVSSWTNGTTGQPIGEVGTSGYSVCSVIYSNSPSDPAHEFGSANSTTNENPNQVFSGSMPTVTINAWTDH